MLEKNPSPEQKTEERKLAMERVEELHLPAYTKAEMVLIAENLKPGIEIDIDPNNSDVERILDTAKKLGLVAFMHPKVKHNVIIAKDTDTGIKLSKVDPSKDHVEYGRLMGFPETAVHAFIGNAPALSRMEMDALTDGLVMDQMKVSRDHCMDELQVLQRWDNVVRAHTQRVYEELHREKYGGNAEISSLDTIDVTSEEGVVSVLDRGNDEVLEMFAQRTNVPLEKVRLIAHNRRTRIATHHAMYPQIAKRLREHPQLDEDEVLLGNVMECVEPQVRDVVKRLLSEGIQIKEAGFADMLGYQVVRTHGDAFVNMSVSKKTEQALAKLGVVITVESNEIRLTPQKECTVEILTAAWEQVAADVISKK